MYRFGLAALFLLALVSSAAAEKQKQMVQFDGVLFVRGNGITGKASIVLFDSGTAQVLASQVLMPSFGMADFFPSDSMGAIDANTWANDVVRDCPPERGCIRWRSIGVLRSSKKHRSEFGLGIGGAVGDTYFWLVPVSLAISDVSRVVGIGDASLTTEKGWRDYTDKVGQAQAKEIERQQQAEAQQQKKDADANTAKAIAMLKATQNLHQCLRDLHEGDPAAKVYRCGYPNHTNSDFHSDQLVYSDPDVYVYIDKATNTVSDVQWRE